VRLGADEYAAEILGGLESEVRQALAGIEKGIGVLEMRRATLRGEPAMAAGAGDDAAAEGRDGNGFDEGADWPTTVENAVIMREEDAGQTVPR